MVVGGFLKFNNDVIEEFRANDGVCGGPFEGMPMILVTMTGAKSGRELCSPLVHSTDGGDPIIIASKCGAPEHPNWYYDLVANPKVTVEVGTEKWEDTAHLTEGDERRRLFDAQAEQMPQFAGYRAADRSSWTAITERPGDCLGVERSADMFEPRWQIGHTGTRIVGHEVQGAADRRCCHPLVGFARLYEKTP